MEVMDSIQHRNTELLVCKQRLPNPDICSIINEHSPARLVLLLDRDQMGMVVGMAARALSRSSNPLADLPHTHPVRSPIHVCTYPCHSPDS